jgi:hypothetical protein
MRFPLHVVRSLGVSVAGVLQGKIPGIIKDVQIVGDARRWEPRVDELILLVAVSPAGEAQFALAAAAIASLGEVELDTESPHMYRLILPWKGYDVPVEIQVVSSLVCRNRCWWLTGSEPHRCYVEERASQRGYLLYPDGLFRRWNQRIDVRTEDEIYAALGLPAYPPETRTNGRPPPASLAATTVCDSTRTEDLDGAIRRAGERGIRELRIRHRYQKQGLASDFVSAVNALAPTVRARVRLKPELEVPVNVLGETPPLPDGLYRVALYLPYRPEYNPDFRLCEAISRTHRARVVLGSPRLSRDTYGYFVTRGIALDVPCHPAASYEEDTLKSAVALGVPVTLSTDTTRAAEVGRMTYGIMRVRRARALQRQIL